MNRSCEYKPCMIHPIKGAAFSGRLFLFSEDKDNRHREYPERKKGTHQPLTTRIELTGKGSDRFCTAGKVGPFRFRQKSSSLRSGIFPENLACGGAPLSCSRIGNDEMFHINKEYNEDNDRIKKEETDMENHPHTAHGTCFQLSLHAGSISRVGGCRHRLLQGILPVPLRDSLPPGNAGHHRRHTEFSNLLII